MNLNKLHYVQKYDKEWAKPYYENHLGIPQGYMLCDGSRLSRDKFPELFEAIGKSFDEKPNINDKTFPLPDLRGHFPTGNSLVVKPGDSAYIIKVTGDNPMPVGTVLNYSLREK
jgi:microcystin-dependent protein